MERTLAALRVALGERALAAASAAGTALPLAAALEEAAATVRAAGPRAAPVPLRTLAVGAPGARPLSRAQSAGS